MVLVQRAVQLCSVHKTICAQIDTAHITTCAQTYWTHIDISFLWMLTMHFMYDNYKYPHVPRNTHIKCLHWKGWQMNCCTCELWYTTCAVRTGIHCGAKRSLSVSMLLWGLPCPDLLGLNSVYAFLLTKEFLFVRPRFSWNNYSILPFV